MSKTPNSCTASNVTPILARSGNPRARLTCKNAHVSSGPIVAELVRNSAQAGRLLGASVLLTEASGGCVLGAMVAAGVFVCIDLENAGPLAADALELLQFDGKTGSFSDKNSFKGQVGDADGGLTLKLDGTVWNNMDTPGVGPSYDAQMFNAVSLMAQPVPLEWNAFSAQKLTDTRTTLGFWDDRVRWTSRQAVSSYFTTGANTPYLTRSFDNTASSQRLDTTIWKTGSTSLSLFTEFDRVGAYFQGPNFAIKPQDPFSTANSKTTRLGGALQQGPVTLTLEQRARQSLAQDNAPTKVENLAGISLGFDDLWGRDSIPEGMSWAVPTSAYVTVGQGRVRAALDQGVGGDAMSDVSAGFLWNRNKVFAYLGYWRSDYQSHLYPWQGLGIDGSVGYHQDQWAIDLYFDLYRSVTSYPMAVQPLVGLQPSMNQRIDTIVGGLAFTERF